MSEFDAQLEAALLDGKQYCRYGDRCYNWRRFMEILFQRKEL